MDKTLQSLRDAGIHPSVVRDGVATGIHVETAIDLLNDLLRAFDNPAMVDAIMNLVRYFHPVNPGPSPLVNCTTEQCRFHLIAAGVDEMFLAVEQPEVAEDEEGRSRPAIPAAPLANEPTMMVSWLEVLLAAAAKYGPGVFDAVRALLDAMQATSAASETVRQSELHTTALSEREKVETEYAQSRDWTKTDAENRAEVQEQTRAQDPDNAFERAKDDETDKHDFGSPLSPTTIKPVK